MKEDVTYDPIIPVVPPVSEYESDTLTIREVLFGAFVVWGVVVLIAIVAIIGATAAMFILKPLIEFCWGLWR